MQARARVMLRLRMRRINLQQTEQDGKASLRVFGQSDEVLKRLLKEFGMSPRGINLKPATFDLAVPRVLETRIQKPPERGEYLRRKKTRSSYSIQLQGFLNPSKRGETLF